MNRVRQLLMAAKALILDPSNWTQNSYARDRCDAPTGLGNPNAACFCASGALMKARDDGKFGYPAYMNARKALIDAMDGVGIPTFNDRNEHSEVLKKFDEAIKALPS